MNKRLGIIVLLAALVYILAANPLVTGLELHEWLSLGCIIVFIIHCAVHYDWFVSLFKRRIGRSGIGHFLLDSATLIAFIVVTVSGIMVSRYILPALGFVAQGYFFWNPLHSISAKVLFVLILVHVVVHASWFAQLLFKRRHNTVEKTGNDIMPDSRKTAMLTNDDVGEKR